MPDLTSIGLTPQESKIYTALLDLGKTQVGVLSRKTGVHRRSIYDILDRLLEKGLVSYILENQKRYYAAVNPKRIQELMEQQQKDVLSLLPQLEEKYAKHKTKQETTFFRGKEGIKSIFEDQIQEGKDLYIVGGSKFARELLWYYIPQYTEKRMKNKIKMHALYAGERHKHPIPFAEIKYLPESFASPVATNVYGDKVAIILWSKDPVAILIKQPDIARTFKQYFDVLWKLARD